MTTSHTVTAQFKYHATVPGEHEATAFFDDVVEHLYAIDTDDVFLSVDYAKQEFVLSVLVQSLAADGPKQVVDHAAGVMRTAFQAAGAATPEWPGPGQARMKIEWEGDISTQSAELATV